MTTVNYFNAADVLTPEATYAILLNLPRDQRTRVLLYIRGSKLDTLTNGDDDHDEDKDD